MRRIVVSLIILALAAAGAVRAQAPAPPKIGTFDASRVSEETAEGKRLFAKLKAFMDKKRTELAAKEKEVSDLQSELNTKGLSLSAEKRAAMEKDLQKKGLELNQANDGAQKEYQIEMAEAENSFREQLLAVLSRFGKDEGFTIILERQAAAYVDPSIDVTTAVVDRFDKMFPPKTEAAPAKPEAGKETPEKPPAPSQPPAKREEAGKK